MEYYKPVWRQRVVSTSFVFFFRGEFLICKFFRTNKGLPIPHTEKKKLFFAYVGFYLFISELLRFVWSKMFSATTESSKRSNLATSRSSFVNNIPWTLRLFIYTPSVGFKQERFPVKGRDSLMFIETPRRSYRYFVNFFIEVLIRISGNKQYFELFILIL